MANNTLPSSWIAAGFQALHPVRALPGGWPYQLAGQPVMWWQECVGSRGEADMRISADQNSASHLSYYTQMECLTDATVNPIFLRSILGGYDPISNIKYAPLAHPYLFNQWAKDITEVSVLSPYERRSSGFAGTPFEEYNLAKVTVSYETLAYNPCHPDSTHLGWTSNKISLTNSRLTQLSGGYIMDNGTANGLPWKLGNQLIRPEIRFAVTYWRVPSQWFTSTVRNTLIGLQGKVNVALFQGLFAAGTCLFDSFTTSPPWRDFGVDGANKGFLNLNITCNYIVVVWQDGAGWNNQPRETDPTHTWPVVCTSISGLHTPPFATADFEQFNALLCPVARTQLCSDL